ncbi:hypothetical protein HD554DRAFT_2041509 [Boletus coccyginus]|nr:hypothetical protein HD554DRAFT_2041509 [Boletus coccyginus]
MPGPVEGGVAIGIRRLSIIILALVAPEIVVMWAVRQFFAARMVQKRFKEALQDGTLELRVKPYSEPRLVSAEVPCDAHEVRIAIPEEVTESWSEKLSSLCSLISATFRRSSSPVHEKLSPSSMSVESLQGYCHWTLKHSFHAWMGGFMLFVYKDSTLPREIHYPLTPDELLEFLEADLVQMSMVSEKDLDDRSKGDWLSKTVAILQLLCTGFRKAPFNATRDGYLGYIMLSCFTYAFWWYKPKDAQFPVSVYWKEPGYLPAIKYSVPQSIEEFMRQFGVKKSWVGDRFRSILRPLLNLGERLWDKASPYPSLELWLGWCLGAVHCIAWNFNFPTHTEQVLWRMASLTMAIMPGFALAVITYLYLASDGTTIPHAAAVTRTSFAIAFLYVNCRLIVMVVMLLSLRSLPAGVYDEVCWTSLIPHL